MSLPQCLCGNTKRSGKAICEKCWHEAPIKLKQGFWNATNREAKLGAIKDLVKFAQSRKPEATQLKLL